MVNVFDFAITSIEDIEQEYKINENVFYEIVFLKEMEVCINIYEAIKDLGIDEMRLAFVIMDSNYEDEDSLGYEEQLLSLAAGVYVDMKSRKHKIDYFSNDDKNFNLISNLSLKGQVDYGPKILDKTNNPVFSAIKELHLSLTNLMDSDNDARYLIQSNLGLTVKPDLGDIVLKMCGERKFNIWKSAVEKKELEKGISKNKVVIGKLENKI